MHFLQISNRGQSKANTVQACVCVRRPAVHSDKPQIKGWVQIQSLEYFLLLQNLYI